MDKIDKDLEKLQTECIELFDKYFPKDNQDKSTTHRSEAIVFFGLVNAKFRVFIHEKIKETENKYKKIIEEMIGEEKNTKNPSNDLTGNPAEWNITRKGYNQKRQEIINIIKNKWK